MTVKLPDVLRYAIKKQQSIVNALHREVAMLADSPALVFLKRDPQREVQQALARLTALRERIA